MSGTKRETAAKARARLLAYERDVFNPLLARLRDDAEFADWYWTLADELQGVWDALRVLVDEAEEREGGA